MNYIPHTSDEISTMLEYLGVGSVEDLFGTIPEELRIEGLDLPDPLTEMESDRLMGNMSDALMRDRPELSFVGAGAYEHFIPSVVVAVASRGEFYTAYTPYQAEISQGTLQAIFEYQTMICELVGMEVANASMYDGASALAEGVLMGMRINRGHRVLIPRSIHPFHRQVVGTYLQGLDVEIVEIPWEQDGTVNLDELRSALTSDVSSVVIQNPNFFGCLESVHEVGEVLKGHDAVYIACVNPVSLGILVPPGEYGADIAVGEGQPLGIPLSFGGPYLGFFASKMKYLRQMPGRIIGQTEDADGKRGYVMTMQTREQHIRRERATSNICSNQALCATMAGIYMTAMGPKGIREVAELNWSQSHQAAKRLSEVRGVRKVFEGPFFNEFVIETPVEGREVLKKLRTQGIMGGLDLSRFYPELGNAILVCVTETKSEDDLERMIEAWRAAL